MNQRLMKFGASALILAALAACQTNTNPVQAYEARAFCKREAALDLTGKQRLTDDEAKTLTGASIIRQISPGQVATMDYRQERLTIEIDPRTDEVVRAFCG